MLAALVAASMAFPSILSARHLFCFYAGVLMAEGNLDDFAFKRNDQLLAVGILIMVFERLALTAYPNLGLLANASASCALIAALIERRPGRISILLDSVSVRYLGKISYSYYLLHLPVLYVLALAISAKGYHGLWSNALLVVAAIVATIVISSFSYFLVELPTIKASRFNRSARSE